MGSVGAACRMLKHMMHFFLARRFYSIGLEEEYSGFKGRMSYITSFYSIVDLAAVLPFYLGILTPLANVNTSFIRALRLLRMLKAEAYVEAFTVFDDIMYNNRS